MRRARRPAGQRARPGSARLRAEPRREVARGAGRRPPQPAVAVAQRGGGLGVEVHEDHESRGPRVGSRVEHCLNVSGTVNTAARLGAATYACGCRLKHILEDLREIIASRLRSFSTWQSLTK